MRIPTDADQRSELMSDMAKAEVGVQAVKRSRDLLGDYTTLYCHVVEKLPDGKTRETGVAYLKFRTFENLEGRQESCQTP